MRTFRYSRMIPALVISTLCFSSYPASGAAQVPPRVKQMLEKVAEAQGEEGQITQMLESLPEPKPLETVEGYDSAPSSNGSSAPSAKKYASATDDQSGTGSSSTSTNGRSAPRTPAGTKVSFDFQDYDLMELVKRISEMTGTNFILSEPLQGKKVTILSPTKITIEEAYQVFLSVLRSSGYTVVPLGSSLKIVPVNQVGTEAIPTVVGSVGRQDENFVTRLFKVDNIDVDQMAGALSKLISPNGSVITYAPTNTLIMTDTVTNLERIIDIIQRLDVESPTEQLVIIPIRFADATDIADKLMQVFGDEGQTAASKTSGRRQPPSSRQSARAGRRSAPDSASTTSIGQETPKISKIIADERTNALIILATQKALEDIQALVSKIDVDVDEAMKSDIHVYYLKYAKAEELAGTLANLAGTGAGGASTATRQSTRQSNTATGRSSTSRSGRYGRPGSTTGRGTSSYGRGGSTFGGDVATFEGGVRVTADAPTNALVITASYNDYQTIRHVIEQLDIRRKQVFVEAVILELSQDNDLNVGINYHGGVPGAEDGQGMLFARGSQSLVTSDSNLLAGMALGVFGATISAPGAIGTALSAITGSDTGEIPAFGVVLQALQQDTDVNILSTPSILTSNNQEAKIVVGQNIPFQSGSTISTIGSNISITREDVALTLQITPQVNESNEVTLEVFQEITEVVPGTTSNPLGPTTTKRSAETVVSVPDNQTAVIGGLIAAKENVAEDKVPILGDIPLIGFLFRTRSKQVSKSNLLIFLTPHIIDTEEDMRNVYRVKMAQRQEFVRRFYGKTQEEQLKELDSLLKYSMNLPDEAPVYPERQQRRPSETTIETAGPRPYFVPIPGADLNEKGPVLVPVFTPESGSDNPDEGNKPNEQDQTPQTPAGNESTGTEEGGGPSPESVPPGGEE